ncbi:Sapep family Mn(2+)-dependent dipeptidase [Haloimpatiens sp. FM7315]|uniref:Sapep family Mn(2+)-dependent dipeptidase n=1 Tax=Haloimpatiens sp. FM7315 TaxID=3298609 RepID=UPI0035A3AA27
MNINMDKYKDDLIKDLKRLVSINSVIDEPQTKAPFGIGIKNAVEECLEIAKSLGYRTYMDPEGYYGYAEIGEGESLFGILGHLDVVPVAADDWIYPPFEPTLVDGKLYGRGTQDDKGPIIAAMYGMKALLDNNIKINKRVRFIFGTDEETLWRGINKYMEKEEKPDFGFSPDSQFPLTNAEKGLLQLKLVGKGDSNLNIKAGNAFNAVPDKATFTVKDIDKAKEIMNKNNFEYKIDGNTVTLLGKAAHAAKPEEGINAISRMAVVLNELGIENDSLKFISDIINSTCNGENIVNNWEDVSGKLTVNVGKLEISSLEQVVYVDVRIPVTFKKNEFVSKLTEVALKYNLKYEEFDYLDSIYIPEDTELVVKLRKVIEDHTDMDSTPLSSGGATYARAMDNCVAFGAIFEGQEKTEHQANEYIDICYLLKSAEIYAYAINQLLK